jgi:hypothetical protein
MDQISEAIRQRGGGSGSGPSTGRPACSPFEQAGSQFQDSVASRPRNPFTDSHAISTLTDVAVGDLERVDMSTFQDGDTGGRLWFSFYNTVRHADY